MQYAARAYVLHVRRFTDSRLLVDFLTQDQGLQRTVARSPGRRNTAIYQLFQPRDIQWGGKSDLKTLRSCESAADPLPLLTGTAAYCGLYLNELLQRVLPPGDASGEIFDCYEMTLRQLAVPGCDTWQPLLREMEFFLLQHLGFGVSFTECAETGEAVVEGACYRFDPTRGFVAQPLAETLPKVRTVPVFFGAELLAIAAGDYSDERVLRAAKKISRCALAPLLGDKPLKSRDLFQLPPT